MLPSIAKNNDHPPMSEKEHVGSGLSYQTSGPNHKRSSMFRHNAAVNNLATTNF